MGSERGKGEYEWRCVGNFPNVGPFDSYADARQWADGMTKYKARVQLSHNGGPWEDFDDHK